MSQRFIFVSSEDSFGDGAMDLKHANLDLSRATGVLIRQSKKKADKDHPESRESQLKLVPCMKEFRGDDNVRPYDEGAGVSGQKRIDQRPVLQQLLEDIENDLVGSVAVGREDRTFRNKHGDQSGIFTRLCEEKKVILLVPYFNRYYDFTNDEHTARFQDRMKESAGYLTGHVKYMNTLKENKRNKGLYIGGAITPPYVVDKWVEKERRNLIIYEPWLEPSNRLFSQFKLYNYSFARLARWVEDQPFIFPDPSFDDAKRYLFNIGLRKVQGGYTFADSDNIKYYLTNVAHIGWKRLDEQRVIPRSHPAAIDYDLFNECYGPLVGQYLDGTPCDTQVRKRVVRKNPQGAHAVLGDILTSPHGYVSPATAGIDIYRIHPPYTSQVYYPSSLFCVVSRELDNIFIKRLAEWAKVDPLLAEKVKNALEQTTENKSQELKSITRQIESAQRLIENIRHLTTQFAQTIDRQTMAEYQQDIGELRLRLQALQQKQEKLSASTNQEILSRFYYIIQDVEERWSKEPLDIQQRLARLITEHVTIAHLSPHWLKFSIEWIAPVTTRPDIALIWRGNGKRQAEWTEREDDIIREKYPSAPQEELLMVLPNRSYAMIKNRAHYLGVIRTPEYGRYLPYPNTVTWEDLAIHEDREMVLVFIKDAASHVVKERGKLTAYWLVQVMSDEKDIEDVLCAYRCLSTGKHLPISQFVPDSQSREGKYMASECSFDIVSQYDQQELVNALDQTRREVQTRFDLKDTKTEIIQGKDNITIVTDSSLTLKNVRDILETKAVRRNLSLKIFKLGKEEDAAGSKVRQVIQLQQGITQDQAKELSKLIREKYPKVRPQVQGDAIRVNAKSRDELQAVITLLKQRDYPIPLQFINYRG